MKIPNAKTQMPKKFQISKPRKMQKAADFSFATWILGFLWRLKFGVWDFAALS
jgi:hypothetical protein